MNFKQAMKNPNKLFRSPELVEASTEFDDAQKAAILVQWKNQLEQLQSATNEGMLGPESHGASAECLRRVVDCLSRLGPQ